MQKTVSSVSLMGSAEGPRHLSWQTECETATLHSRCCGEVHPQTLLTEALGPLISPPTAGLGRRWRQ